MSLSRVYAQVVELRSALKACFDALPAPHKYDPSCPYLPTKPNATDAIHYRHIMPVRVAHTQQLRVLLARRQIAYLVLVVYLQRIIRAKVQHPTVAQIHTRHAVRGRWHNKALVKAKYH